MSVVDLKRQTREVSTPTGETRIASVITFRRALALADMLAATFGIVVLHAVLGQPLVSAANLSVPAIVLLAKLLGRYDQADASIRRSTLDEIPSLLALAAYWVIVWAIFRLAVDRQADAGDGGAVLWGATAGMLLVTHAGARSLMRAMMPQERILIVGNAEPRVRLANSLSTDPSARVNVVGFLPLEDERHSTGDWRGPERRSRNVTFSDLERLVIELSVERVLLVPTTADTELMLDAVRSTLALGVNVSVVPRLFEVVGSAVDFDAVGGVTVLGIRRPGLSRSSRAVKRTMDMVGSGLGLLALSPLLGVIALAVKLDTAGPVFFRQARVGRDGQSFDMLKFRSMVDGADAQRTALTHLNETDGMFKVRDDPRITPVGRILRRTSIDELPQLINVVRGEMSLVGPRPLINDEDLLIEGRHRDRLTLAPGMTGPWQVLGPSRPPLSEMVKTDYLYATNWSMWADVKILMRTLGHVTAQRGQ